MDDLIDRIRVLVEGQGPVRIEDRWDDLEIDDWSGGQCGQAYRLGRDDGRATLAREILGVLEDE